LEELWFIMLPEIHLITLPREHAMRLVAHEVAHAWLGTNNDPNYADDAIVESLAAEWLEQGR
jgi:hypothetical protein